MTETEIWADVKGYAGYYQISNHGRVRSVDRIVPGNQKRYKVWRQITRRGKILTPGVAARGYYNVVLCKDGKPSNFGVHRLVADHFIANPNDKPCVNHIDANRLNNHISNLEWCTVRENNLHTRQLGRWRPSGTYKKLAQTAG